MQERRRNHHAGRKRPARHVAFAMAGLALFGLVLLPGTVYLLASMALAVLRVAP